jgi:hypothetical protein
MCPRAEPATEAKRLIGPGSPRSERFGQSWGFAMESLLSGEGRDGFWMRQQPIILAVHPMRNPPPAESGTARSEAAERAVAADEICKAVIPWYRRGLQTTVPAIRLTL